MSSQGRECRRGLKRPPPPATTRCHLGFSGARALGSGLCPAIRPASLRSLQAKGTAPAPGPPSARSPQAGSRRETLLSPPSSLESGTRSPGRKAAFVPPAAPQASRPPPESSQPGCSQSAGLQVPLLKRVVDFFGRPQGRASQTPAAPRGIQPSPRNGLGRFAPGRPRGRRELRSAARRSLLLAFCLLLRPPDAERPLAGSARAFLRLVSRHELTDGS